MSSKSLSQLRHDAMELTREIDQATDAAVNTQQEQPNLMNRERAGQLGGKILTYNPNQLPEKEAYEAERVKEIAEIDNGYVQKDLENPNLVGAETEVQVKERLAEDREDIENESGVNGEYVKNLMERNNKRLTDEAVQMVDRVISKNEYHPNVLDREVNNYRRRFLKEVFNRILGSRN